MTHRPASSHLGTTRRHIALVGVTTSVLLVAGCAAGQPTWVRSELYFGLTRPDGSRVTDAESVDFLNRSVTPRFPDGLTIVRANGRFRTQAQELREEPTGILIILHPRDPAADAKVRALAKEYVARFDQESVLRSDSPATATFITAAGRPGVRTHAPRDMPKLSK